MRDKYGTQWHLVRILGMATIVGMMVLFFGIGSIARADPDRCEAITRLGVFNTQRTFSSADHFELVKKFICTSEASTKEEMQKAAASVGIGVEMFSLNFGGQTASSNYSAWKKSSCSSDYSQIQNRATSLMEVKTASEAITSAWAACIQANGLRAWLSPGASPDKFFFIARYQDESLRPATRVTSWVYDKRMITCNPSTVAEIHNSGITALCTRPPNAPVDMALNTSHGSRQLQLWPLPSQVLPPQKIEKPASAFTKGLNIEIGGTAGDGVVHNGPPYTAQPNMVEYQVLASFTTAPAANYTFEVEYAAAVSRPVQVSCNGIEVNSAALAATTGSWGPTDQKWGTVGVVSLQSGVNVVRISRSDVFPHIRSLRFTRVQ